MGKKGRQTNVHGQSIDVEFLCFFQLLSYKIVIFEIDLSLPCSLSCNRSMDTTINFLNDEDFMTLQSDPLSSLFDGCSDLNIPANFESNNEMLLGFDTDVVQNWINAENVQSDHDYAGQPSDASDSGSCEISSQMSPNTMSDSGISSSSPCSRSPAGSDYTRTTPVEFLNEANSPSTSSSETGSEANLPFLDDLQFDFSDVDMDNVARNFPMTGEDILDTCLNQINNRMNDNVCIQLEDNFLPNQCPLPAKKQKCTKVTNFTNSKIQTPTISPQALSIEDVIKGKGTETMKFKCTLPNFKPLVLNEEEKKLLTEENVTLPTDLPLTKSEERILKRVRRKIRNKKSAMESRKRRKQYLGGLEDRVTQCTSQNQELVQKVKDLESRNASLISQLRRLQEIVRATTNKTTQATTCVMVLLLSFGLFLAPNYGPLSINKDDQQMLAIEASHKSRRVLEITEPEAKQPRMDVAEVDVPMVDVNIKQEVMEGSFPDSVPKVEVGVKPVHETDTSPEHKIQPPIKEENNSSNNESKSDGGFFRKRPLDVISEDNGGIPGSSLFSERSDSPLGLKILDKGLDVPNQPELTLDPVMNMQKAKVKVVHISRIDEM